MLAKLVFFQDRERSRPGATGHRSITHWAGRGQAMVEFALISTVALIVLLIGIQFALIGQAALALSQGSFAVARYASLNAGTLGTNGSVSSTLVQSLVSSSIYTNSGSDLSVKIASFDQTTGNTTTTPQFGDRLVISLSYNASSKLVLTNPFLGISFPTNLKASESAMYEN
jgi:Flp pilus assembly protein TadG